jgi:hypothetical protein
MAEEVMAQQQRLARRSLGRQQHLGKELRQQLGKELGEAAAVAPVAAREGAPAAVARARSSGRQQADQAPSLRLELRRAATNRSATSAGSRPGGGRGSSAAWAWVRRGGRRGGVAEQARRGGDDYCSTSTT